MNECNAIEFFVSVSMSDLLLWDEDRDVPPIGNRSLVAALLELGFAVDIGSIAINYFESIPIGRGDVYLYGSTECGGAIFAINLYRDPYDQLDVICFGVRCPPKRDEIVAAYLREFFEAARYRLMFLQSPVCKEFRELIEPSRYPLTVGNDEFEYRQRLIHVSSDVPSDV